MTGKDTTRKSAKNLTDAQSPQELADAPEGPELGSRFWDKAEVRSPRIKTPVQLRLDADIVDFFKADGPGHLTRMNAVLRSYVDAKRQGS